MVAGFDSSAVVEGGMLREWGGELGTVSFDRTVQLLGEWYEDIS